MEHRRAIGVGQARLDHAEEIVDAVDLVRAEEWVTFHVENEVAGRRWWQHQETHVGLERAVLIARRCYTLRDHEATTLASHLDRRLCADSGERVAACALEAVGQWRRRLGETGARGDVHAMQR